MKQMEEFAYGTSGGVYQVTKDEPALSSSTNYYTAVYGKKAWSWLNQEANVFSVLEKKPWNESGWRAIHTRSAATGGGVVETSAVPDTLQPDFLNLTTKPKQIAHSFDMSGIQEVLSKTNVGAVTWEDLVEYFTKHHAEMMNIMLLTQSGSTAGYNLESIDRVTATTSEDTSCTENNLSTAFTAGDNDIYTQDRDSTSTTDSNCLHNSGVLRALTLDLIDELIETVDTNANADIGQRVFITGHDTLRYWASLLQSGQRFDETEFVSVGVNGVKTVPGREAGFRVRSYAGYPIIPSKNVVIDDATNDGLGRIYLLDLNQIHLRIAAPTQFFKIGLHEGNPWGPAIMGEEGLFRTLGELICTSFKNHGKIRDIKHSA